MAGTLMPSELAEAVRGDLRGRFHAAWSCRGASAALSAEELLEGDGWEHLAAAVPALVVVGVDEHCDLPAGLVLGQEVSAGQELVLESRVEALGGGVVLRRQLRLMPPVRGGLFV